MTQPYSFRFTNSAIFNSEVVLIRNHLIKDACFCRRKFDRNGRIWDSLYLGATENVCQEMTMDEMKTNKLPICLMYIFPFFFYTFWYVLSFFFICDGASVSGILDRYSHLHFLKSSALIVSNETMKPEQLSFCKM